MLRFSIEAGPRRANCPPSTRSSASLLIPISFLAIRLAEDFIHPTVFTRDGPQMAGSMFFTFCVCLARDHARSPTRSTGSSSLGKRLDANLRELREMLTCMSSEREVRRCGLPRRVRRPCSSTSRSSPRSSRGSSATRRSSRSWRSRETRGNAMAELLVFPALLAYGEAAFAYAGELRGPGLAGRLATWGVRLGWLAQTALLVGQGVAADGFPWGTWAGALNLFVWLVVGAYLIWGCTPALPAARARRDAARRGAARARVGRRRDRPRPGRSLRRRPRAARRPGAGRLRRASRSRPGWRRSTSGRSGG